MSRSTANPRLLARDASQMDPNQPCKVYVDLSLNPKDLDSIAERLRHLVTRRDYVVADIAALRRDPDKGVFIATLEIDMGPLKDALRGSDRMQDGAALLWEIWESLYDASPRFTGAPSPYDRESVQTFRLNIMGSDADA